MLKFQPSETVIKGNWLAKGKTVHSDENCERMEGLVSQHLVEAPEDWSTLFKDPDDGRYWEHTYPQSHMHGGGPPQLELLTQNEAKIKYGVER